MRPCELTDIHGLGRLHEVDGGVWVVLLHLAVVASVTAKEEAALNVGGADTLFASLNDLGIG